MQLPHRVHGDCQHTSADNRVDTYSEGPVRHLKIMQLSFAVCLLLRKYCFIV
jgi:hypothetical protein